MNCQYINSSCSVHELVDVLISSIEAKDCYTRGHSDRVAEMTSLICQRLILSKHEMGEIHIAAHLHDLGKIYVSDVILNKVEKLTEDEWREIKMHPVVGAEILAKVRGFERIVKIVRGHHERWDGKGYPDGLTGEEIPLGARVIAVSDSIDAMLSERPYRKGLDLETCLKELERGMGNQFDTHIARLAVEILRENPSLLRRYESTGGVELEVSYCER